MTSRCFELGEFLFLLKFTITCKTKLEYLNKVYAQLQMVPSFAEYVFNLTN